MNAVFLFVGCTLVQIYMHGNILLPCAIWSIGFAILNAIEKSKSK
jgi:hypothetical protein